MENPYASLYGNKAQQPSPADSPAIASSSTAHPAAPWCQQDIAPVAQPTAALAARHVASGSQEVDRCDSACAGRSAAAESRCKRRRCEEQPASAAGDAPAPAAAQQDTVLVWDLDETLVLFQSLHDGRFAAAFGMQDPMEAPELGRQWQDALTDLCDAHFFFEQIQDMDQTRLDSLAAADDLAALEGHDFAADGLRPPLGPGNARLLAYRYREMRARYLTGLAGLCSGEAWQPALRKWEELYRRTDELSHGWLSRAAVLVTECSQGASLDSDSANSRRPDGQGGKVHNVVVTTGQLVPTLAKLLLFRLSAAFPPEGIYSARNRGKQHCFALIRERYGAAALYCVIGDGVEEQQCAQHFGWPFVRIVMDGSQAGKGMERLTGGSAKWQPCLLTGLQAGEILAQAAPAQLAT